MLFMMTYTFEPAQEHQIIKRQMEKRTEIRGGFQIVGEWLHPGGGKGFILFEADDEKVIRATTLAWSDIMKVETLPVVAAEEAAKLAKTPGSTLLGLDMKL